MTTLVGLVPGERGSAPLHLGAMLARSFGDDLVVASVVPTPWPPHPYRADAEYLAYQETAAQEALDRAQEALGTDVPSTYVLHKARSVASGLLECAHDRDATSVVLGSSSSGPLGQVSLGGIADRVLHGCGLPLCLAPAGFASAAARVERFTVGFGRSDGDGVLLAAAAASASTVGASLRVACLAVRPMTSFGGTIEKGAEYLVVDEWARHLGRDIAGAMLAAGLAPIAPRVESVVGQGTSWPEAISDVDWAPGDVLVVGSSASPFSRLLGSHAAKIVRSSPVPVLVVPRAAARSTVEPVEVAQ